MKLKDEKKIGIFDSGVGGLTVAREILKILPFEQIIYFGDTARCPYGPRSEKIVREFSLQNVNFLLSQNVKFIVVACNTSSALALDFFKKRFEVPMMGVIEPGAKGAVEATKNKKVGVIGTVGTITSGSYVKAIHKIDNQIIIYPLPCPLFVSLTEEGFIDKKATYLIAEEYLKPLKKSRIDTLILGCTHYPLLKGVIKNVMRKFEGFPKDFSSIENVTLIDSAEKIALDVKRFLLEKDLLRKSDKEPSHKFFVSDQPDKFKKLGQRFLGKKIKRVELVDINKY